MRDYAVAHDITISGWLMYDVIVIGTGAAGLYAALNLDSKLKCLIINKGGVDNSNSVHAQGGIASVSLETDSFKCHYEDTLVAGAGLCNKDAVRLLVQEGPSDIERLINMGVPFDRDSEDKLIISKEAAHSCNRIVHCGGDATGFHVIESLVKEASLRDNIEIVDKMMLIDIVLNSEHRAAGIIVLDTSNKYLMIKANNIIIATGGIGRLYRNSTNSSCATGDGIGAALRAGAVVSNMQFVQFHPTALIYPDNEMRYFLISEALRGEGAILVNRKGERFMLNVHPMADLAPRDIVSRAIINEMKKNDTPNVYLNITFKSRTFLKERFPKIYDTCMRMGIDIAVNWIPVVPTQHYFMGGVTTDIHGRTSVNNLYAAGESACSGVHGANRLASNSLLECLVFGRRSAEHINGSTISNNKEIINNYGVKQNIEIDYQTYKSRMRYIMTNKCGIIRRTKDLVSGYEEITGYYKNLMKARLTNRMEYETLNIASVSIKVLENAIAAKESIGAHYIED